MERKGVEGEGSSLPEGVKDPKSAWAPTAFLGPVPLPAPHLLED